MIDALELLSIKILMYLGVLNISFDAMLMFLMILFNGRFTFRINSPKAIGTKSSCVEELKFELFLLKLELDWLTRQEHKDS